MENLSQVVGGVGVRNILWGLDRACLGVEIPVLAWLLQRSSLSSALVFYLDSKVELRP